MTHPADAALEMLTQGRDRSTPDGAHVFSSDLSVDEAICLAEAGFEPRRLVMGCSMFHIGVTWGNYGQNMEITQLSEAMHAARDNAISRLTRDAQAAGGDGVVGVQLRINMHHSAHHIAEFVAIGTAVRIREEAVKRLRGIFFTSDLSGQDLYLLVRAGYRPVGLVMGCCVYHVASQGISQWMGNAAQNIELTNYTEALYEARELAMERLQSGARRCGADGVVGVTITEASHVWGSRAIEFLAVGTAIRALEGGHQHLRPTPAVSLTDDVVETEVSRLTGGDGD